MNILFLTIAEIQDFNLKGIYTDLLREFMANGHKVFVALPLERRHGGQTFVNQKDNGAILRVRMGNIQKTNIIEKGISTLLIEHNFKRAIKKHFKDVHFDMVMYTTPTITFEKVVSYIKKKYNAKSYLLLKDIFPQNAVDLGMMSKKGLIYKYFRRKEKRLYKVSDRIGCMSRANVDFVLRHNKWIDKNTLHVSPNSVEPLQFNLSATEKTKIKSKYGIPNDKTVFVFGGNFGEAEKRQRIFPDPGRGIFI